MAHCIPVCEANIPIICGHRCTPVKHKLCSIGFLGMQEHVAFVYLKSRLKQGFVWSENTFNVSLSV